MIIHIDTHIGVATTTKAHVQEIAGQGAKFRSKL